MERDFCQHQKKAEIVVKFWLKDYFLNKHPDSNHPFYFIFTSKISFREKAAVTTITMF